MYVGLWVCVSAFLSAEQCCVLNQLSKSGVCLYRDVTELFPLLYLASEYRTDECTVCVSAWTSWCTSRSSRISGISRNWVCTWMRMFSTFFTAVHSIKWFSSQTKWESEHFLLFLRRKTTNKLVNSFQTSLSLSYVLWPHFVTTDVGDLSVLVVCLATLNSHNVSMWFRWSDTSCFKSHEHFIAMLAS